VWVEKKVAMKENTKGILKAEYLVKQLGYVTAAKKVNLTVALMVGK
jgi:hypothetical protein